MFEGHVGLQGLLHAMVSMSKQKLIFHEMSRLIVHFLDVK